MPRVQRDKRRQIPPRASNLPTALQWKSIYSKRVLVERVFSRLKTYRKLDVIRTRGLPKVWLHVALSVIVVGLLPEN